MGKNYTTFGKKLHETHATGKQAKVLFEQAKHELGCFADGELSAELIEGKLYATPFFDYGGEGLDKTRGMQIFDRRIQGPLATGEGHDAGEAAAGRAGSVS